MPDIRGLLEEHPDGLTRDSLFQLARESINQDLTTGQLDSELELLEDEIIEADGLVALRAAPAPATSPRPSKSEPDVVARPMRRLVALDLETVLRYTETSPLGERTVGRESERIARGEFVEKFLRLDLEERLDRIGPGPVAFFHRPVALVLEHLHHQIAGILERSTVQRNRLIGRRIDLGQQPRLGISAGAVDFTGPRAQSEPVRGNGTFQRHVGYLIRALAGLLSPS